MYCFVMINLSYFIGVITNYYSTVSMMYLVFIVLLYLCLYCCNEKHSHCHLLLRMLGLFFQDENLMYTKNKQDVITIIVCYFH